MAHADARADAAKAAFLGWCRAAPGDGRPETLDDLLAVAAQALEHADASAARVAGGAAIACREGCAHCCYLPVAVSPVEALLAWRAATAGATAAARRALARRTRAAAAAYAASPHAARPPPPTGLPPCPLLDGDRCRAYAARPLACRAWNSTDVSVCVAVRAGDRGATAVPSASRPRAAVANVGDALARGLAARGLRAQVWLAPALAAIAPADDEAAATLALLRARP